MKNDVSRDTLYLRKASFYDVCRSVMDVWQRYIVETEIFNKPFRLLKSLRIIQVVYKFDIIPLDKVSVTSASRINAVITAAVNSFQQFLPKKNAHIKRDL